MSKTRAAERFVTSLSSMQYSDDRAQVAEDLREVFAYRAGGGKGDDLPYPMRPWSVAFTEVRGPVSLTVRRVCARYGYTLYQPKIGGDCIAIHPECLVASVHYEHVLDAQTGLPKGNYTGRGVVTVVWVTPAGNVVSESLQHYLTAYQLDTKPGPENRREERYSQQVDAHLLALTEGGEGRGPVVVPTEVARAKSSGGKWALRYDRKADLWMAGRGGHIALGKADTNVDERDDTGKDPDALEARFSGAGIRSVFDLGAPLIGTHGAPRSSVIDVTYLRDDDHRARLVSVVNHGRRNSDHNLIDVALDLQEGKRS